MLAFDLPTIWAFIIAFAIFAYVVMDGFDLGIGILFSWIPTGRERDTAMNSIAPVWDGNETWLVLGGGGLLAAFPLAYSIVLSALYTPLIAMPLARSGPSGDVGLRVHRGIFRRGVRAGRDARRAAAGHPRDRPRVRRRLVG